jgi:16S rRNA (uracil1498-N3)-methyltransferase
VVPPAVAAPGDAGASGPQWAASAGSVAHVFAAGLGDDLEVDGPDGHHLARVLRLRPGEPVSAADGTGTWRLYRVGEVSGSTVLLVADGPAATEPRPRPALAVAFALTKGDRPELVVQKLTELGVDRILPVTAERSVVRLDAGRADAARLRWQRVAREAARQCRRARLPEVAGVTPLASLRGHFRLVVAEHGAPPTLPADGEANEVLVVVGPEGGLTGAEIDRLKPWARLGLGPHVLRAETAAIAAAAVVIAARDDRK